MNFSPELCRMSVGNDSSASDNHTCHRRLGEAFCVFLCVCLHLYSYVREKKRKEGRKTGFQSSHSDPIGSLLPAGILRGSRHQYFLIAPEAQNANTDFNCETAEHFFGFLSRQGETHCRQNI